MLSMKVEFMSRLNWMLVCFGVLAVTCLSHAQPQSPTFTPDEEQALLDATDTDKPTRPQQRGMMGEGRRRMDRNAENDGPPPRRGQHEPPVELTMEQQQDLFTVLKEVNPQLIEKIKTWQEVNPERSSRMLARMYGRMQDMIDLKAADPTMYELKVQDIKLETRSRILAMRYRRTPTEESKKELLDVLNKHFELRQKVREHELHRLKSMIGQLETQIEQRTNNREKIINKQLDEITSNPGSRKW